MKVTQPLAVHKNTLLEVNKLSPAEIAALRNESIFCPVCKKEGILTITEDGPLFAHTADHESETKKRDLGKKIFAEQLRYIFSEATVERNIEFTGQIADIALLHPKGTRIAIRYITSGEGIETLPLWREALLQDKIHFLSLLDADRLPVTTQKKKETEARKLVIGKPESMLLALGEDLLYFHVKERLLHLASISERVRSFSLHTQGKRIGSVPAVFYRHNLSALRVVQGRWYLDNTYNDPSPIHGFEEQIPGKLDSIMRGMGV
jgi:hypothetical protein